jgi:hypothetical protein
MSLKRKATGGLVALIGFLLSPLSWWNDAFVNLPLALVFAWVVSAFYRPAFTVAWVLGYWLTNVLGLVLMRRGANQILGSEKQLLSRRELLKDLGVSLLYTLVIVALAKFGVLQPLQSYLPPEGK